MAPDQDDGQKAAETATLLRSPRWLPLLGIAAVAVLGFLALPTTAPPPPDPLVAAPTTAIGGETTTSTPTASSSTTADAAPTGSNEDSVSEEAADGLPLLEPMARVWPISTWPDEVVVSDYLVAATERAYVIVDPLQGEVTEIPLSMQLSDLGVGLDSNTFYGRNDLDEAVYIVAGESRHGLLANRVDYFAISARPGRVWIGVPAVPDLLLETDQYGIYYDTRPRTSVPSTDPRYVFEPGGGLYRMGGVATALVDVELGDTEYLGPHEPLATSEDSVVGRTCDAELSCWIEHRRDGGNWERVVAVPSTQRPNVTISNDGRWIVTDVQGVALHARSDDGFLPAGQSIVRPNAEFLSFSNDGRRAYFTEASELVLIDLGTGVEWRVALPDAVTERALDWVALPALAAIER